MKKKLISIIVAVQLLFCFNAFSQFGTNSWSWVDKEIVIDIKSKGLNVVLLDDTIGEYAKKYNEVLKAKLSKWNFCKINYIYKDDKDTVGEKELSYYLSSFSAFIGLYSNYSQASFIDFPYFGISVCPDADIVYFSQSMTLKKLKKEFWGDKVKQAILPIHFPDTLLNSKELEVFLCIYLDVIEDFLNFYYKSSLTGCKELYNSYKKELSNRSKTLKGSKIYYTHENPLDLSGKDLSRMYNKVQFVSNEELQKFLNNKENVFIMIYSGYNSYFTGNTHFTVYSVSSGIPMCIIPGSGFLATDKGLLRSAIKKLNK